MINNSYILPQVRSFKRVLPRIKKIILGNLAFALISLPIAQPQSSLIIPQEKLDSAFNISIQDSAPQKIQIPVNFIYMSQGFSAFHPAIDLATKFGIAIKPVLAGTVEFAGYSPFGYGNEILIDNGNGMESLYAHLSKIEVKEGDTVDENTEIGQVGTSGHATGPHLHLEIHENGKPVNPISVLPPLKEAQTLTFDDDSDKKPDAKPAPAVTTPVVSITKPVNNLLTKLPTGLTSIQQ